MHKNKPDRQSARPQAQGTKSRLIAANMLGLVTLKHASLDDLLDAGRGYNPYLGLSLRDQSLVRAIVTTSLRHRGQILAILSQCWNRPPPKKAELLNNLFETAVAQIAFMNVPERAAVSTSVEIIRHERKIARFASFANAVLRKAALNKESLIEKTSNGSAFPDWLQKRFIQDHGRKKTSAMAEMFRKEPVIDLNGLPGYENEIGQSVSLSNQSVRLTANDAIGDLPGYKQGKWWVQDFAASQPVKLLNTMMRGGVKDKAIADLCAAPGGKTLQLAALGANVTAVDISKRRIERLVENLNRTNLYADIVCSNVLEWEPALKFDGIILDAPCSATGTIRRHPDIVWNSTAQEVSQLSRLQKEMICKAADWLKPGGVLVYANCSLLKEEGENLVGELAKTGLGQTGLSALPILADKNGDIASCINGQGNFRSLLHSQISGDTIHYGMDGFFCALFEKL